MDACDLEDREMATSILVLEDHTLLRKSMSRVLAEIPGTEVDAVGTLQAAMDCVRQRQPELVVADLELPDGSGIDLLHELSGSSVPFIFVSGFVPDYIERLGQHPSVMVLEKPMPMQELQTLALAHIEAARMNAPPPFTVADYVQLSCLGRHSVRIEVEAYGDVYIDNGSIWAAHCGDLFGPEAFYVLALLEQVRVRCTRVGKPTVSRNIENTSWEYLLLEAARRRDESTRRG